MAPPPSPAEPAGSARLVAGLVAVAGVLGVLGVLRHAWWRDEAYTWLVVRASSSPANLFARLGFNGHPRSYYLLAYGLYHLCPSPLVLSLSNLAFALGAIGLVVRSAPFPTSHKALFAVGFFPLYQYGVIARSYSVFLFFLFLYAHLKTRWPERVAWRLVCLAVLAQIHLLSMAAAGVLLFLELVDVRVRRAAWAPAAWLAAASVGLSLAGAAYSGHARGPGHAVLGSSRAVFVQGLANGFFPNFDRVPRLRADRGRPLPLRAELAGGEPRSPHLAALCPARGTPGGLCAFIYDGHRWHHGFDFICFFRRPLARRCSLAARRALPRRGPRPACAALCMHALAADVRGPYSNGAEAARAIQAQGLTGLPLLGVAIQRDAKGEIQYAFQIDEIQPVLLDLPGARAYDPRAGTYEPYWKHYTEPEYFAKMSPAELAPRLGEIADRLGEPLVIVLVEHNLPEGLDPAPPPLRRLASFARPLDYGERMGVYLFPRE